MTVYKRKPNMECSNCGKKEYTYWASNEKNFLEGNGLFISYIKGKLNRTGTNQELVDSMPKVLKIIKFCENCGEVENVEEKEIKGGSWENELGKTIKDYLEEKY